MSVYFIRAGDYIKIGHTRNVQQRIAAMQTGSPVPLELLGQVKGNAATERHLHQMFSPYHIRGEWYQSCDEIVDFIKQGKPPAVPTPPKKRPYTQHGDDDWRFELKRKPRQASRKNSGSTAADNWYYWLVRIHPEHGTIYYGTLDEIGLDAPKRRGKGGSQ